MDGANFQAEIVLPTTDLHAEMPFFEALGFRLDHIYPSDDPTVAILSGHGLRMRLDKEAKGSPGTINLLTDDDALLAQNIETRTAPNGTTVKVLRKTAPLEKPQTQHHFEVRRLQDGDPWVIGRAGMLYRDLIPDRLGGSIIASHIRIPEGGPVPDMVHYHTIGFQLIFCYRGWVKLVYEDQGEPFILRAGDCVNQPPEIRHRVLEASDNLQVIEIGVPASHMTTIDHQMELPTEHYRPERVFGGQRFCHHKYDEAQWTNFRIPGFKSRDTGMNVATNGVASVEVIKPTLGGTQTTTHDGDILFAFVMEGSLQLTADGHESQIVKQGDAFVVPPGLPLTWTKPSDDLEILEVALPGTFNTQPA